MVEVELERLAEQMQKNYLETSQEVEVLSQELKSLEAQEAEVAEAKVISSEALDAARDQIKKAKEMNAKANLILSKAEPMSQAETIPLEEMTAKSIHIQHSKAEKRTTLEELKSHLETVAAFKREELKPQALLKAEEERKNRLSALEAKIKPMRDNLDL